MKPETKAWLDKLVPLLAHLNEGGKVCSRETGLYMTIKGVYMDRLVMNPDGYSIHVEPRVIYVNESNGHLGYYTDKHNGTHGQVVRFVEDLNWKQDKSDRDADHHLPEPSNKDHTPPQCQPLSKQATDYQKTV